MAGYPRCFDRFRQYLDASYMIDQQQHQLRIQLARCVRRKIAMRIDQRRERAVGVVKIGGGDQHFHPPSARRQAAATSTGS